MERPARRAHRRPDSGRDADPPVLVQPAARNPFGVVRRWYVSNGITALVAFLLGVIVGHITISLALRPESYSFPTYKLELPALEPDT